MPRKLTEMEVEAVAARHLETEVYWVKIKGRDNWEIAQLSFPGSLDSNWFVLTYAEYCQPDQEEIDIIGPKIERPA